MNTVEGVIAFGGTTGSLRYARCARNVAPAELGATLLSYYTRPDDVRALTELRTIHSVGARVGDQVDYESAVNDAEVVAAQCISPWRDGGDHAPPTGASGIQNLLQSCAYYGASHCYVFDPLRGWHVGERPFPERVPNFRMYPLAQFFRPLTAVLCTPREHADIITAYLEWLINKRVGKALAPNHIANYAEQVMGSDSAAHGFLARWNSTLAGDQLYRDGDPLRVLEAYQQDDWWLINRDLQHGAEAAA